MSNGTPRPPWANAATTGQTALEQLGTPPPRWKAGWMKATGFNEVCRINLSGPSDLIVGE